MYGPRTDWVKNAMAAKEARLSIDGHEIELQAPRLVKKDDIWPLLPATTKVPPSIKGDSQLLRMDIREPASQP